MSEEYCRFELIYPSWVAWLIVAIGAALFVLGVWRLATRIASGILSWPPSVSASDIFPLLLFLVGLVTIGAGIGGVAALTHQPFGRWAVGHVPALLSQADEPVTADFNARPLSEIVPAGGSGYYTIRLSPAARSVKITGVYKDALCDTDLLWKICRNNGDKLSCDNDPKEKILRICTKADSNVCQDHTL